MANFLIRVELHGGDSKDYTKLHEVMENGGYSRSIKADGGRVFDLPTVEYVIFGNYNLPDLTAHAKNIANSVKSNWVFAVEYSAAQWDYG
jgi:hypothetical protein